jgi:hypothetical protein
MPRVGFEPTNPAMERTKTVEALDRVATDRVSYEVYISAELNFLLPLFGDIIL